MTDKEKLKEIKKLANAMYYAAFNLTTDASRLHKAMNEYYQFIINEYHKEEPVSEDLDSFAIKYAQDKPYPVTVCQAVKAGANYVLEQIEKLTNNQNWCAFPKQSHKELKELIKQLKK